MNRLDTSRAGDQIEFTPHYGKQKIEIWATFNGDHPASNFVYASTEETAIEGMLLVYLSRDMPAIIRLIEPNGTVKVGIATTQPQRPGSPHLRN